MDLYCPLYQVSILDLQVQKNSDPLLLDMKYRSEIRSCVEALQCFPASGKMYFTNNRVLQLKQHLTTLCRWQKVFALIAPYTVHVKTTIPWIFNFHRGQKSRMFPFLHILYGNNSYTFTLQSKDWVGFNVVQTHNRCVACCTQILMLQVCAVLFQLQNFCVCVSVFVCVYL